MSIITPASLEQYQSSQRTEKPPSDELGQDEFLKLMLEQLKHQDPFKPMENGEFIGQMAQFSTVSGIEQMQAALEDLSGSFVSNQTLEASRLVGKEILIESDTVALNGDEDVAGRFELESSSGDVQLTVSDSSGEVVTQQSLGEFPSGRHDFSWNGLDRNNNTIPAGAYTLQVTAKYGDTFEAASTLVSRRVVSVEFSKSGAAELFTSNGESLSLPDVRAIRQTDNTEQ